MDTFLGVFISSSAVMISTSRSSPAESITQIPPTPCFQMCYMASNQWQMMLFPSCMITDSKEGTLISSSINMLLSFLYERPAAALRDGVCFLLLLNRFSPAMALLKPALARTPGMAQALTQPPPNPLTSPQIRVLGSFGLHRRFSRRGGGDPQPPASHAALPRCRRASSCPGSRAGGAKVKQHTIREGRAVGCRVGHHAGVMLITLVCFLPQAFSLLLMSWRWYNIHCYVDPRSSNKQPLLLPA